MLHSHLALLCRPWRTRSLIAEPPILGIVLVLLIQLQVRAVDLALSAEGQQILGASVGV